MTIYDRVDNALSGLNLPYYYGLPKFSGNEPQPASYLVYSIYDTPELFADGEEQAYTYNVTVNIITPAVDVPTRKKVRDAMKAAGFVYRQGLPTGGGDEVYPYYEQYSLEFFICLEE